MCSQLPQAEGKGNEAVTHCQLFNKLSLSYLHKNLLIDLYLCSGSTAERPEQHTGADTIKIAVGVYTETTTSYAAAAASVVMVVVVAVAAAEAVLGFVLVAWNAQTAAESSSGPRSYPKRVVAVAGK